MTMKSPFRKRYPHDNNNNNSRNKKKTEIKKKKSFVCSHVCACVVQYFINVMLDCSTNHDKIERGIIIIIFSNTG